MDTGMCIVKFIQWEILLISELLKIIENVNVESNVNI